MIIILMFLSRPTNWSAFSSVLTNISESVSGNNIIIYKHIILVMTSPSFNY